MRRRAPGLNGRVGVPIGLVVEGLSEYMALPVLMQNAGGPNARRVHFGGQGENADLRRVAAERIAPKVRVLILKKVAKVVVVLDRERRVECAPEIARLVDAAVREELGRRFGYRGSPPLSVVCADRTLENWLIADPARVARSAILRKRPVPLSQSRVDDLNACELIKRACKKNQCYVKTKDAPALAQHVRTGEAHVQERSRSLKKFVKEACGGRRGGSHGSSSRRS